MSKRWTRRLYQKVALVAARKSRAIVLFWARQCRKSTTLGDISFDEMSREAGRNVIGASASLLTGSELVSKALTSAEQAQKVVREAAAVQAAMTNGVEESGGKVQLKIANAETGKVYAGMTPEDFADLYSTSRLEMRLYHNKTAYSRLLIIAPNPATARGWTGTVIRDEAGFTHANLERDLQVAVKPIMDTDPTFRLIYASNLCRDDRHPFFETTLPEPGLNFAPNASGNFYRGQNNILIHRVALVDAYAAGHVLYDSQEGKPMTYEQFCADPANKLGLDESYRLVHNFGGAAAIDLFALLSAQRRGVGLCRLFVVSSDSEFEAGLDWLVKHLPQAGGDKQGELARLVGVGIDPATTTLDTSNPTSVTVSLDLGGGAIAEVAVFVWKERDPKVARARIRMILQACGPGLRRVCLEATSEQYFARETAQDLAALAPWELVDVRNKVEPVPVGYERDPSYKTFLSDSYSARINDNRYSLPPEEYFKVDHRMVVKSKGVYDCTPDADGRHGDTFTSGMLAQHALTSTAGAITSTVGIRVGGGRIRRARFQARRLR